MRRSPARVLLALAPALLAAPLAAQVRIGGTSSLRWTLTVSAGPLFGGPGNAMRNRFLEEGWTETTCSPKGTGCHGNPVVERPPVQFTAAVGRRFGRRFEAQAMVARGVLGAASGRRDGFDVTATWSAISFGAVMSWKPVPVFRLGAGPLLGFLNSAAPPGAASTVIRPGVLFESGLRTSDRKAWFLSLSTSYRLLGTRLEGPWPARKESWQGFQGPSRLRADYSHLSVDLGAGMRF